jgi:hypothetical protein
LTPILISSWCEGSSSIDRHEVAAKSGGLDPTYGSLQHRLWGFVFPPSGANTGLWWTSLLLSVAVLGYSRPGHAGSTPCRTWCSWTWARCPGGRGPTSTGRVGGPLMFSSASGWTRISGGPQGSSRPHGAPRVGPHDRLPYRTARPAGPPQAGGRSWRSTRPSCRFLSPCP